MQTVMCPSQNNNHHSKNDDSHHVIAQITYYVSCVMIFDADFQQLETILSRCFDHHLWKRDGYQ